MENEEEEKEEEETPPGGIALRGGWMDKWREEGGRHDWRHREEDGGRLEDGGERVAVGEYFSSSQGLPDCW